MMRNITLRVEDDVIKKVRKLAIEKNTTLASLVRGYLQSLAKKEMSAGELIKDDLEETFDLLSGPLGPRDWKREDLYKRGK